MRRIVALLAAVSLVGLLGCGDDGAEPGASREAILVLDFTPNAVHAGIYAALERGYFADRGINLKVQEPGATTDAAKLLAAGKADYAVMDINDLAIARERGADLTAIAPVVDIPLASVIAGDREEIRRPRDLEGRTVGVTGVPSDNAVLDAILRSDGADPGSVKRVTIGFDAVGALSAGKVDAATAFWNAEGVSLQRQGVAVREFRLADEANVSYPELLLVTESAPAKPSRGPAAAMTAALAKGDRVARIDPGEAATALTDAVPATDAELVGAQLRALNGAGAFGEAAFRGKQLTEWQRFAEAHGLPAPSTRSGLTRMFGG